MQSFDIQQHEGENIEKVYFYSLTELVAAGSFWRTHEDISKNT
jgi:hypothetical protein